MKYADLPVNANFNFASEPGETYEKVSGTHYRRGVKQTSFVCMPIGRRAEEDVERVIQLPPKRYLGDSVYVEMDNDMVKLTTQNTTDKPSNTIYLEERVINALIKYWEDVIKATN